VLDLLLLELIASSQAEDPTMKALTSIMSQLEDIKKTLERIEGKLDALSDLVLVGFERSLTKLETLEQNFNNFANAMLEQAREANQREAIQTFVTYLHGDPVQCALALNCDQAVKVEEDQFCRNEFAKLFADHMIGTNLPYSRSPRHC
jgi:DNA mismatch repair ATPase MutS